MPTKEKSVKLAAFVFDVTMSPETEFITLKRERAVEAVEFINAQLKKYNKVGRKKKFASDKERYAYHNEQRKLKRKSKET